MLNQLGTALRFEDVVDEAGALCPHRLGQRLRHCGACGISSDGRWRGRIAGALPPMATMYCVSND
jgi:hypothetical protein